MMTFTSVDDAGVGGVEAQETITLTKPIFQYKGGIHRDDEEDEEPHWRAAELGHRVEQRVIAREKRNRLSKLAEEAAKRRALISQLKVEQKRHGSTGIQVVDNDSDHRHTFVQSDQQFRAMQSIRYLSEDAQRNVRRQRENVDKLDDLTRRLIKLKARVKEDMSANDNRVGMHADKMVDTEFRERFRGETTGLYRNCSKCGMKVLLALVDRHEALCNGAQDGDDEDMEEDVDVGVDMSGLTPEEAEARRQQLREKYEEKRRMKQRATQKKEQNKKQVVVMAPQAPRDVKFIEAGHNHLTLAWKEPILDGGAFVYEYELAYCVNYKKKVGKSFIDDIHDCRSISTTEWIRNKPVNDTGFTIHYLQGGTEYCNFRVRCRNKIDWGPWSAPLDKAETLPPVAPTVPLFFRVDRVSATTIFLKWGRPIDDGGADLVDFELSYIEIVPREDLSISGGGDFKKGGVEKVEEKFYKFRLGEYVEEYLMIDLRGDNDYKEIKLAAINKAGLYSEVSYIDLVHTSPPSWRQQLEKEIQRVTRIDKDFIDTDFYLGYSQRLDKDDYLRRLGEDLQKAIEKEKIEGSLTPEEREAEAAAKKVAAERRAKRKEAQKNINGEGGDGYDPDAEAFYASVIPAYDMRKRQFTSKIDSTEKILEETAKEKVDAMARRAELAGSLAKLQERIIDVKSEMSRVAEFKGKVINSDVVHGSDQRFTVVQLKKDLEVELEKAMRTLAQTKNDIIACDKHRKEMIRVNEKKREELKVARARYTKFNMDAKRMRKLNSKAKERDPMELMEYVFETWSGQVAEKARIRGLMQRVWGGTRLRSVANALHKWKHGEHTAHRSRFDDYDIISRGGQFLCDTEVGRERNTEDIQSVIRALSNTKTDLSLMKRTNRQLKKLTNNDHFAATEYQRRLGDDELALAHLVEGGGFLQAREWDKAKGAFISQIRELKLRQRVVVVRRDKAMRRKGRQNVAISLGLQLRDEELEKDPVEEQLVTDVLHAGWDTQKLDLSGITAEEAMNQENEIIHSLSITYSRLAKAHYGNMHWDRGILSSDRAMSLAKEVDIAPALAASYMVLAEGYLGKSSYDDSAHYFELAMLTFRECGDAQNEAEAHRGLQESFWRLNSVVQSEIHKTKADEIEKEMEKAVQSGAAKLDALKRQLIATSAVCREVIELERITANCIRMRKEKIEKYKRIDIVNEELVDQQKAVQRVQFLADQIDEQLQEAADSAEDEMKSHLITGIEAIYDIEELKIQLKEKKASVAADVADAITAERAVRTRIDNIKEEIRILDEELSIEEGPLMSSVMKKRQIKNVALNAKNTAGNEVLGTASGGIELIAASEGKTINVFDIHTGELLVVFSGDDKGRHVGEAEGHLSTITCMYFYGDRLYTGGLDTVVHVWDVREQKRVMKLEGHEASVNCVIVDEYKILTGSTDNKIHIWDLESGAFLRMLHGHTKTVNCLDAGHHFIVSGGSEGHIRVWDIPEDTGVEDNFRRVRCKKRLKGHECAVTAVSYGFLELVSAGIDGRIFIWWLKTGEVIRTCQAHSSAIRQLQFDASRIVSAGNDGEVTIVDITTGEVTQKLRGHTGQVLATAFDTNVIVTAGADSTFRVWEWGDKNAAKEDKLHIWGPGDTLPKLSERYNVAVPDLIKWNAIRSTSMLYAGFKLVVQKGDPTKPTKAEQDEAERKQRQAEKNKKTKTVREAQVDEAKVFSTSGMNIADSVKIPILPPPLEMKSLSQYGYTGYGDNKSMSSRFVSNQQYEAMGEHLLDKDYADAETRRSGREFRPKVSLHGRIATELTKDSDADIGLDSEPVDEIARLEAQMQYRRNDADLANQIFALLIGGVVSEEAEMLASEEEHQLYDTWWTETLGARVSYRQAANTRKQETRDQSMPVPAAARFRQKMPPIKGSKATTYSGVDKRRGEHTFDMRRKQSAWRGLSTMEPGSAYGIIDPNFSRRRPRPEEVAVARKQERILRKLAGVQRLVPLTEEPEAEGVARKEGNVEGEDEQEGLVGADLDEFDEINAALVERQLEQDRKKAEEAQKRQQAREKKRKKRSRNKTRGDEGQGGASGGGRAASSASSSMVLIDSTASETPANDPVVPEAPSTSRIAAATPTNANAVRGAREPEPGHDANASA